MIATLIYSRNNVSPTTVRIKNVIQWVSVTVNGKSDKYNGKWSYILQWFIASFGLPRLFFYLVVIFASL